MRRVTEMSASFAALLLSSSLLGQSPWLPPQGEVSLNPSYTFETFDEYWLGKNKEDLSFGDVDHHRILLGAEYTVLEDLALDATFGYVRTLSSGGDSSDDALDDTTFGARYRIIDEFEEGHEAYIPTVTLRVGGVIEGTHFTDGFAAPGKGASGFEGSVMVGKVVGDIGLRVFGDLGYRLFSHEVPDDFFVGAGVSGLRPGRPQRRLPPHPVALGTRCRRPEFSGVPVSRAEGDLGLGRDRRGL